METKGIRSAVLFPAFCLLAAVAWAGCTVHYPHGGGPGYGPPPHAPAHGYRYKAENGAELRFDSGLGLYVVVGLPDYYFDTTSYYRLQGDVWQVSLGLDGPWKPVSRSALPSALRYKAKKKKAKTLPPQGRGHW